MACFNPLKGFVGPNGKLVFSKAASAHGYAQSVPCGQCIGCRIDYTKEWAIRCTHEAQMYDDNMFLTLTYDDEHLPADLNLDHEHFQKFIRAIRDKYNKYTKRDPETNEITEPGIRYYMCGEYGGRTGRPHYHAIIFNFRFPDLKHEGERRGHRVWSSADLEELWGRGMTEVGSVTFQSASYVARYIQKKLKGPEAKRGHPIVDHETGEIVGRRSPEYTKMSLKPGIGETWLAKYYSDVFPEDLVTLEGGKKIKAPRYYRDLLKKYDPELWEECREKRIAHARANADNSTEERLAVREKCLKARVKHFKRDLD